MNKQIERLLLSVLCATSVLLALTFWLNTYFGFNLFSSIHWHELSVIQASGESISKSFYISFGVAVLVFIICLNIIYRPKRIKINTPVVPKKTIETHQELTPQQPTNQINVPAKDDNTQKQEPAPLPEKQILNDVKLTRPPKLNLPKNIAQIAATQHAALTVDNEKFDKELDDIFSENSFLIKKSPTISGLKLNLFAIGANETVWMGGVNCNIEKIKSAIEKLESIFTDTLEDIPITVNAFVIDTLKKYNQDSRVHVFHSMDELRKYISENPGEEIPDTASEDFNAYSDYIDTVLSLLYNTQ